MKQLNTSPERSRGELNTNPACPSVRRERSRREILTSDRLTSFLFYLSILFFIIGFNFSDNRAGGWTQQFMPSLGGRQIVDITFTDSLNGYAVTNRLTLTDTSFILKTANGGDNWFFSYSDSGVTFNSIQFINQTTGFVSGRINRANIFRIVKTTNAGLNWFYINAPFDIVINDLFALNEDTIWVVNGDGSTSQGVFFTSTGGTSWINQLDIGANNPDRIYMYNARIGFVARSSGSSLYKTENGGNNWTLIANNEGFNDMYFVDSLTGWKAGPMKKTTNGGLNWITQIMPTGPNMLSGILRFSNINKDTIWGCNGYLFIPGQGNRAFLHRTINGGENWLFQVPDTSYQIPQLAFIDFVDKFKGWAYMVSPRGIHTTTGGNDTFFTSVNQISSEVPKEFKLFQNYPNPFNPKSNIKYQIVKSSYVTIKVYSIEGKEIEVLVSQKQDAGIYETVFNGSNYSSGIYFYSLIVEGKLIDTKKMILIK